MKTREEIISICKYSSYPNYISHKYKGLFHTARQVFKNRPRSPVNRLYSFYCAKENRKLIP